MNLEPGARELLMKAGQLCGDARAMKQLNDQAMVMSIAISLKRIADAAEKYGEYWTTP